MSWPIKLDKMHDKQEETMQVEDDQQNVSESNENEYYIIHNANLDVEAYANNYASFGRIYRLLFVADHCPSLRIEALTIAMADILKTYAVQLYEQIHMKLKEAIEASDMETKCSPLDTCWITNTLVSATSKLDRLDTDLKQSKANSITESIRRCHEELGIHYLDCGDIQNALMSFSRMRDYCSGPKKYMDTFYHIIEMNVYLQKWLIVGSFAYKILELPAMKDAQTNNIYLDYQSMAYCAAGLSDLCLGNYKNSAVNLLKANFDYCDFPEIISPNNVAIYAGLCGLATFDRQELYNNLIFNSFYRNFSELEPQIKEIITTFYHSKYALCLKKLDEIKDNLLLDMFLAPHVKALYNMIRNRGMIQYFSTYLSVNMDKMATAFNITIPHLEEELMYLIMSNQIFARIDSYNKIVYAKSIDQRTVTYENALSTIKQYLQLTSSLILKSAMLKIEAKVEANKNKSCGGDAMP